MVEVACWKQSGTRRGAPTGVLFATDTGGIAAGVRGTGSAQRITASACRENAARFSAERFRREFAAFVAARQAEFANGMSAMNRSLLKDNAPLFEGLVRLFDLSLLVILAGWLAYRWYLRTGYRGNTI
jgi:hypothetical protein